MARRRWVSVIGIASLACLRQQPVVIPATAEQVLAVVPPPPPIIAPPTDTAPPVTLQAAAAPTPPPPVVMAQGATTSTDSADPSLRDITRGAVGIFGDSVATVPVVDSAAAAPSWDIDVRSYETTARVALYVKKFSGPAKETVEGWLARGTRYEQMIRQELRAGGLPEDMYYLALIESGFDPNAYSKAAAVGMWQFMTTTARGMGLRVDWWVDERRDPVRSTTAAVGFLKGLNEQFGSLYLAAAAYNGGPGRITRGLTRYATSLAQTTGDDLFFALSDKNAFRVETRDYVPQLIAAALIGKDPTRYGVNISAQPVFTYDTVRVGPFTPLVAIALAAGVTVDIIRELNPQILRGMTPPRDTVRVRVPAGTAPGFDSVFAALSPEMREGAHTITTVAGETMAAIAKRSKITTAQLNRYNPSAKRLKSGNLVAGQSIVVPTAVTASASTSVPDPAIERYGGVVVGAQSHVVQSGEFLGAIAKKHGTTVQAIMQANGMKKDVIFPGQVLVLPKRK